MKKNSARWIRITHLLRRDEDECSSCGARAEKPYKACPRCGIAMKGSEYEPSWVDEAEAMDAMFGDR